MFPILWGLLQSIVFTVFSNAGGVLLSITNIRYQLLLCQMYVIIISDNIVVFFCSEKKFPNKVNIFIAHLFLFIEPAALWSLEIYWIWDRKDLEMETFVFPVPNLEDSVMSLRTSLGDGDWNKNGFHVKKGNALIRVKENRNHAGTNRKMYEHAIEQGEVHIFTEKMWCLWWDGRKKIERYLKLHHHRTGKDFVHRCLFALFQNRGQCRAQHADRTTFAWRRFWDACTSISKNIHITHCCIR